MRELIVVCFVVIVELGPLIPIYWYHRRRKRALRGAAEAERAQKTGKTNGDASIFHGVVEAEDGEPPIAVEIEERRKDISTGGGIGPTYGSQAVASYGGGGAPIYRWDETSRHTHARPFLVRTDDGNLIRVEPDEQVLLIRGLDQTEYPDKDKDSYRVRKTALQPGESVFVVGAVERAAPGGGPYRDDGAVASVRAPRRGRLVVSTIAPQKRLRAHARACRTRMRQAACLVAMIHLFWIWTIDLELIELVCSLFGYHGSLFFGLRSQLRHSHLWMLGLLFLPFGWGLISQLEPWYEEGLYEPDDPNLHPAALRRRAKAEKIEEARTTASAISLDAGEVRIGEPLNGRVAPGAGVVRAICYVTGPRRRGKKNDDRTILGSDKVTPEADGSFSLEPDGPVSWEGHVVKVRWVAQLSGDDGVIAEQEFQLGPGHRHAKKHELAGWEMAVSDKRRQDANRAAWHALLRLPLVLAGCVGAVLLFIAAWPNWSAPLIVLPVIGSIPVGVPAYRLFRDRHALHDWLAARLVPVRDVSERVWPGGTLKVTLPERPRRWSLVHIEQSAWKNGEESESSVDVEVHGHGEHTGGVLEVSIPRHVPSTLLPSKRESEHSFRRIDWELRIRGRRITRRVPIFVVPGGPPS